DQTPEGKSIIELANVNPNSFNTNDATFIEFTAETRSSGIELVNGTRIRKGAFDAIRNMALKAGNHFPDEIGERVKIISSNGGTPLVVSE
ncbi:potassium-transporting ATPase subunit B, partial [Acinetobacter baumannii]